MPGNDSAVVMSFERKCKTDKELAVEFDSHIKGILNHHIIIILAGVFGPVLEIVTRSAIPRRRSINISITDRPRL